MSETEQRHESNQTEPLPRSEDGLYVQLTYSHLDIASIIQKVKSPEAGAIVTFTGDNDLAYGHLVVF